MKAQNHCLPIHQNSRLIMAPCRQLEVLIGTHHTNYAASLWDVCSFCGLDSRRIERLKKEWKPSLSFCGLERGVITCWFGPRAVGLMWASHSPALLCRACGLGDSSIKVCFSLYCALCRPVRETSSSRTTSTSLLRYDCLYFLTTQHASRGRETFPQSECSEIIGCWCVFANKLIYLKKYYLF